MKKTFEALMNLNIRWKLFICYIFAAIVPLALVTGLTYYQTQSVLSTQSYNNMKNNILQINSNISESLNSYYHIIDIITVNKYIQDYIAIDYTDTGYEEMYFFIDSFLKSITLTNPFIESITIYSQNQTLPQDHYYFQSVNANSEYPEWYTRLKDADGSTLYGAYFANDTGSGSFSLVRNMTWHNVAVPTAVLSLKISERQIAANMEKLGGDGAYFIIDHNGTIIFSTDAQLSGTSIDALMERDSLTDLQQQTVDIGGQTCIVTSLALSNGWRTVAAVPQYKFFEAARNSTYTVGISFLLFSAFAAVLTYLVSYALSKKTRELTWAVNEMRTGNFGVSLPITSHDEIGELTAAFNEMSITIDKLISEVYQKELTLKQSELNMLQEQVRPHFLYNALSSISSLAMRNQDEETCKMVRLLSEFYRISLNNGKSKLSIRDELALTQCYVSIQKVRFRDKITVLFEVDEALLDCQTLKLILQPILENSINHGLGESNETLSVRVSVKQQNDTVCLMVEDNGQGMDDETLQSLQQDLVDKREGFGLKNVNVRIQLFYGSDYGLRVESSLGAGTCVTIIIPREQ